MFKRIVSRLPFSPSLIKELGSYAKNLRKEEALRRTGLILTAIALIIQSLIVLVPPESANAANRSDLVRGGIHSKRQLLAAWDKNSQGFRDIMKYAGITRKNLADTKFGRNVEIHSRNKGKDSGWRNWGRVARFGLKRGEVAHKVGSMTLYSRPLSNHDGPRTSRGSGSWYRVFLGKKSNGEPFAITKNCGNLLLRKDPTPPKMTVCRLSDKRYPVVINQSQFNPKKYSKNPADCKPKPSPLALCSSLQVKKLSRTKVEFRAKASATNGAAISGYHFVVKDSSGKEVDRKIVKTTSKDAVAQYDSKLEGSFKVVVIVKTSAGDKTSKSCEANFTIEPVKPCPLNPSLPINHPDCQPCPGDPTIWVKDEKCAAKIIRKKSAKNLTAGKDATKVKAKASDRLEYTLTVKNEGKAPADFVVSDEISDVLEYSKVYDYGGGTLNEQTKTISWPKIKLAPGEQQTRIYVVRMASKISPMAQGASDSTSFNCKMTNIFGNTLDVNVDCPVVKNVERVVEELPRTGPTENMIFGGIMAAVVTFFYLRSRQLNKEVRLIRKDVTAGTI
ncbi:hypothetical protein CR969_01950 [Candidatus Saccharibacteria bacterium]|nr:MAG: hypothetical protein CR969_01950 [Candidatus Saccharibacteria bacterium]